MQLKLEDLAGFGLHGLEPQDPQAQCPACSEASSFWRKSKLDLETSGRGIARHLVVYDANGVQADHVEPLLTG